MTYKAPVREMEFVVSELCDLEAISTLPGYEDATPETVAAIFEEAGKFAGDVLSPLNRIGDESGAQWHNGAVTTHPKWREAYAQVVEMGWNAPSAPADHGGMGLPNLVNACIQEMFQGANMAFQLCPMLTQGAIDALEGYADAKLLEDYLPKLVSGEWTGTMNLTEPQAGSDLSAVRSTATPDGDHYRIKGQKIYITYGEHDLAENIIHLVLARLPDAPAGVKGISLFLVPKFTKSEDGAHIKRNDVHCVSIEHKLGIHGSPTCTLIFGDNEGAEGYLIGEPNRGLEYMFAMMNNARLNVGIQGIGVSEHAAQDAAAYAAERNQGGTAIENHADVRRMLNHMRVGTDTARILACRAAASLDIVAKSQDPETRAFHQRRVDLLIPIVKGYATEQSVRLTSLGIQVYGGMGYVEETGVAQHLRDARITTIYEGTTGIQALDLVGRKILRDGGQAVSELVADMRKSHQLLLVVGDQHESLSDCCAMVERAAELLEQTVQSLISTAAHDKDAVLGRATETLELFGICLGAWAASDAALKAFKKSDLPLEDAFSSEKLVHAQFYAYQIFPLAEAKAQIIAGRERTQVKSAA